MNGAGGPARGGRGLVILGAGMSGLAAGYASGAPVYEQAANPGGICASYYLGRERWAAGPPQDGDAYRFEIGGGHWIWGGDPVVLRFLDSLGPLTSYERRAAVYFPDRELTVPYPLQNHLSHLGSTVASRVLKELGDAAAGAPATRTMAEWLRASFGDTLCELFFGPFHELYTAGLWTQIAPQDGEKSPIDLRAVADGARGVPAMAGYNASFMYPRDGLDGVARGMARTASINYGKRVTGIDVERKLVHFDDAAPVEWGVLLSTLPLAEVARLAGVDVGEPPDPHTSVLVINIGGRVGDRCPTVHWVYVPGATSGFHRVGFYSNVDEHFLPAPVRHRGTHVSAYVERAYPAGARPDAQATRALCKSVCDELRDWRWITDVDVLDATWIDVAYTWRRPGSRWRDRSLRELEQRGIYQVGRYARWADRVRDQGLVQSIQAGLMAGAAFSGDRLTSDREPA